MNPSKRKGTAAETAVVNYLQSWGYAVERRALQGSADRGDIAGLKGLVVEVKAAARMELAQWIDESEQEMLNDQSLLGVVWHKRRGKTSPGEWYVSMPGRVFMRWLGMSHPTGGSSEQA